MSGSGGVNKTPWPPDSYASSVGAKKHKKLNRNVINVILEKLRSEQYNFGDELVGEICKVIGVNVGTQTMGYQVHFTPREITLSVVLRPEIGAERFCSQEVKHVRDGLRIVAVKPDNLRVVKLRIVGLYFNTPDSLVIEYLENFGIKVTSQTSSMDTFKEGPWRGQLNGERVYQAEVHSQKCPMGSYHLMDGARVKVIYTGNTKTCARCHSPPDQCPGNGIARQCEAEGTDRVSLSLHLKQLAEKLLNINKGGANSEAVREKDEEHYGNPAGAGGGDTNHHSDGDESDQIGTPPDAGTPKVPTAPLGAGTSKVTTPPPGAGTPEVTTPPPGAGTSKVTIPPPPTPAEEGGSEVNHESDGDGGKLGAGTSEVTTSPLGAGTREVTTPPPGAEKDGEGGTPKPGTPPGVDTSGVTLSPPGAGTKEVTTPAQKGPALADELAAAALADATGPLQSIESWANESQSSFEKSKFKSPGGTIPTELTENNDSLQIFGEVIDKALNQDTPKKNAFEMLMSSTPVQRPTSGLPRPSRSKSVKRGPNRTPEDESKSRRKVESDA